MALLAPTYGNGNALFRFVSKNLDNKNDGKTKYVEISNAAQPVLYDILDHKCLYCRGLRTEMSERD